MFFCPHSSIKLAVTLPELQDRNDDVDESVASRFMKPRQQRQAEDRKQRLKSKSRIYLGHTCNGGKDGNEKSRLQFFHH